MDNRPRFEPPTPSHSRSRSPSPTRRAIALLRNAEPPVKIEPESHIPDEGLVADAFEYFMVTQKLPYIPESIAAQLGRLALRKLESTAVGQVTFGNIADSVLVQELDNIVFRAERCERFHQDENAWGNVVRLILDLMLRLHETRSETHREFEVIDLRSQAIDTQFLPQTTSIAAGFTKAFDKRVDFAIAFDIDSDRVKAIHDTTRQAGSNTSLTFSHMSDTYTQLLPLTCPIEVKRKGGNSEEAELQLAIWQAGAFRHRSIEWNEPLEIVRLVPWGEIPQISWTVVGHTWTPYLSWYTAEEGLLFVPIAMRLLNSRKTPPAESLRQMQGLDDMTKWLDIIGITQDDLTSMGAVHVAGTNGKTSLCFLLTHLFLAEDVQKQAKLKVGTYTSPHIFSICDRIQINGQPISKKTFGDHFLNMWNCLPKYATPELDVPRYLQLLFLLSLYIFKSEKVDIAIIEAHMGGKHDATNVIDRPYITVITPVSLDHEEVLGPTLQDIAGHKAGIMKRNCPILSSAQAPIVTEVVTNQAKEVGAPLTIIQTESMWKAENKTTPQVQNEALAIATARLWLKRKGISSLGVDQIDCQALNFKIPGRLQVVRQSGIDWYLDSAHNEDSLSNVAHWFRRMIRVEEQSDRPKLLNDQIADEGSPCGNFERNIRVLLFAHFSKRDHFKLFDKLWHLLRSLDIRFSHVVITTYTLYKDKYGSNERNLNNRGQLSLLSLVDHARGSTDPAPVHGVATIEEAVEHTKGLLQRGDGQKEVLVTGSIHLISGVMQHLGQQADDFFTASM
ncbi:Mur ligase middle domain-containing protein [Elsinoe fawcettii]|nr:Mur ligase middle domain-containing protein [Elsinoe fawcettii]